MFIERLINQTNAPLVEQVVRFAAARHRVIAQNVANVDTPGYRQKDLSESKFYAMLRDRSDDRRDGAPGAVGFSDVQAELEEPTKGILCHDQNNRSMEHLMADQARNGMLYTLAIELLKKQFSAMEMALKERVM